MIEPHVSVDLVVPFLVEEELVMPSQRRIDLSMLVEVRGVKPAAVTSMLEQDHAFPDVDEHAHVLATATDISQ